MFRKKGLGHPPLSFPHIAIAPKDTVSEKLSDSPYLCYFQTENEEILVPQLGVEG